MCQRTATLSTSCPPYSVHSLPSSPHSLSRRQWHPSRIPSQRPNCLARFLQHRTRRPLHCPALVFKSGSNVNWTGSQTDMHMCRTCWLVGQRRNQTSTYHKVLSLVGGTRCSALQVGLSILGLVLSGAEETIGFPRRILARLLGVISLPLNEVRGLRGEILYLVRCVLGSVLDFLHNVLQCINSLRKFVS